MLLPNRHSNSGEYRYGFQGQELDNELKGEGNSYDFGARMYDSRVGRWFAVDPLEIQYPMYSPYSYAANSPLVVFDSDGESIIFWIFKKMGLTSKEAALQVIDAWGVKDEGSRNFLLFVAGMASASADINIIDMGESFITDGNQFAIAYKTVRNLVELDWDEAQVTDILNALVSASPVPGIVQPFTELYKDFTEEGRDVDFFESGRNTILAGTTVAGAVEGVSGFVKPKVKVGSNSTKTALNISDDINRIIDKGVSSELTSQIKNRNFKGKSRANGTFFTEESTALIGNKFQLNLFTIVKGKAFKGTQQFGNFVKSVLDEARGVGASTLEINVLKPIEGLVDKFRNNGFKIVEYDGGFSATKEL